MGNGHGTGMAELEGDVAGALCAQGQFSLAYAPVARLDDGHVSGAIADLRWMHPMLGMVPPDALREAVENSSVAQLVSEFALEAALSQSSAWLAGGTDVQVSVALLAVDLADAGTPRRIAGMLARAGLRPASLEIRVSANAPMMSGPALASRTLATLGALLEAGVAVSLEDVEWCAGGLAALLEVPATAVALDGHFVGEMARDPSAARVVHATTAMARAAGLGVNAPAVANRAQRDVLRAMGVTHVRGPLYGRPGDAEAFARAVARRAGPRALAA